VLNRDDDLCDDLREVRNVNLRRSCIGDKGRAPRARDAAENSLAQANGRQVNVITDLGFEVQLLALEEKNAGRTGSRADRSRMHGAIQHHVQFQRRADRAADLVDEHQLACAPLGFGKQARISTASASCCAAAIRKRSSSVVKAFAW